MASAIDCKYVEENDLATRYLAAGLPEAEAEAFERHYLGCERCRNDVRALSELRATLGKPPVVPAKSPTAPASGWRLLASAAVLALAAFGIWQLTHRPQAIPHPPVYRGSGESFALHAESLPEGNIRLTWPSNAGAQLYVVEVLRSDGASVWKRETTQTSATLEKTNLVSPSAGVSLAVRVEALDPMRQVVARSELVSLAKP